MRAIRLHQWCPLLLLGWASRCVHSDEECYELIANTADGDLSCSDSRLGKKNGLDDTTACYTYCTTRFGGQFWFMEVDLNYVCECFETCTQNTGGGSPRYLYERTCGEPSSVPIPTPTPRPTPVPTPMPSDDSYRLVSNDKRSVGCSDKRARGFVIIVA